MAAVRSALASDKGEGNWTAFSGALERRFACVSIFSAARKNRRPRMLPPSRLH